MKSEIEIAKELDKFDGTILTKEKRELHKQTCERWLEFLNLLKKELDFQKRIISKKNNLHWLINRKIKELEQVVKK
jgi:hypothetical protein